jgi:hypothetical protein
VDVEQISVFLENRSGGLADVVDVLAAAGVDLRALSVADQSDFGILRLIVDDDEKATRALRAAGFTAKKTPVVAVEIPDRPGGLGSTLHALKSGGINVEYMYAFVKKRGENAVVIFRFDEVQRAVAALRAAGVRILDRREVHSL